MDEFDNWVTATEAEKLSGYDENYIRVLARDGKVVGRKFGSIWMIDKDSILEYAAGKDERWHAKKEAQNV